MKLSPNTRLGRYEIRSPLGAGGMGEVYLALDTELDRTVALKILPAELAVNQQRMERFIQEAKSASGLNHPNIPAIYEIGSSPIPGSPAGRPGRAGAVGEGSGTVADTRFIAMEFIDGQTLRQRMRHGRLKLNDVLETAIQAASALAAAHAAGIIHRDIKPENIMVRRDGYIKLLDFGLAKLTEPPGAGADTEAPTKALVNTGAGTVMGTANYMSPEQARGKRIDARTDLWSLGAVIYEMVTGHAPFEAETPSEVIGLILNKEPAPLARYDREAPPELERIVTKALTKDRDERYQTAKDLGVDLRRLKHRLDVDVEIERTVPPEFRTSGGVAAISGPHEITTSAPHAAAGTASAEAIHQASSAEYIVTEIKRHKKVAAIIAGAVLVIVATAAYFAFFRKSAALTDKDTILLADFVNTTGDTAFDGTLKQALAVQLGQSPFLSIFSDQQIREALRFMGRSADERITTDVAREICERQGIKALLAGSISSLGSHYVITLEAINGNTGEAIAREQTEAENKEQVIRKLGEVATKLRRELGESLASIQKFDAPVEQATTSSLEALKAFSLGDEQRARGNYAEAIPFYKRATELDPNFALAYARTAVMYFNSLQPESAAEFSAKAFALRDRVSERERLYIESRYYDDVVGDLDKYIEILELWKQTYPRDSVPPNNLALVHNLIGPFEKAVEEAGESIRLDPNSATGYANLSRAFMSLNRFDEAKTVIEQALARKLDTGTYHVFLYMIAFLRGDAAAMQQQVDWAAGKPSESLLVSLQANAAISSGQLRKAKGFSNHAVELALGRDLKEFAGGRASVMALSESVVGDCQPAKESSARGLSLARNKFSLSGAALALAMCGEVGQAQSLADELAKRFPRDSYVNVTWLPTIRSAIEINGNNPAQAIQLLQAASRYEMGNVANLLPAYVRGLAYLRQRSGAEAMAEFQKILDHRGVVAVSPWYPLAHLGLGRAAVLTGDTAKARKAYQDFFGLWKDADPDIPILIEAKKEYEKLQ